MARHYVGRSRLCRSPSSQRISTGGISDGSIPLACRRGIAARRLGTAFGIEPEILPEHDHSGAIRDVDGVLRFVLEFIDAVYPVHSEKSMTDAPLGEPEGA